MKLTGDNYCTWPMRMEAEVYTRKSICGQWLTMMQLIFTYNILLSASAYYYIWMRLDKTFAIANQLMQTVKCYTQLVTVR